MASSVYRQVVNLIGNTPLLRVGSLSDLTGCEILVKELDPDDINMDKLIKKYRER